MGAVFFENSCGRKLPEFVTDHVFRDEDGIENLAIVNEERVTDEIRGNRRTSRPGLDRFFRRGIVHFIDFFEEMLVNERTFFQGSTHN